MPRIRITKIYEYFYVYKFKRDITFQISMLRIYAILNLKVRNMKYVILQFINLSK